MAKRKFPAPLTVLMIVIVIAAAATWILPAGRYDTLSFHDSSFVIQSQDSAITLPASQHLLDSLHILIPLAKFEQGEIRKPVSIPGTYRRVTASPQGLVDIIEAPIKGIYDTIDIILFLLIIGGFMNVFHSTGAMEAGIVYLSVKLKGKEKWLIIILTLLFGFGGASYGMAEETMVFYPVLVPLFLAAGYDLLLPAAVIFGGSQLGTLASFTNPFSTIIASNAAGINWIDGLYERLIIFIITIAITIWYFLRYAKKIKKNPEASLVRKIDGIVEPPFSLLATDDKSSTVSPRARTLLLFFLVTFLVMITGVVFFDWWLTEMSALFLGSAILIAIIVRMPEKNFLEKFIRGAETLLAVTFIVGVARGVTIILNNGNISDTILFHSAELIGGMPPALFIVLLLLLYNIFTLFISSSSGMAVVTMPIIGSLGILAGIPGREVVNAYLFGMGIMGFVTPTGLALPSLALVNVSYKAWLRFIYPLQIILFIVCAIFLVISLLSS